MKRKIILSLVIAVILFSSCNKADNTAESSDENQEATTISFGLIDMQTASSDPLSSSNRIHQKILEDFGINIEVVTLNAETWQEEIETMIANNNLPDVFYFETVDEKIKYRKLIDIGMVRDIPKSLWSKRENLARVLSWYEGTYAIDDKMYFVPRTYQTFDQTHGSSYAILYRRDWAYVVGAIPSEKPHFYDVMNMFRAFVANDPDENSVKDTWGITGGGDFDFINHAFLQPFGVRQWMYEDSRWIPGLLSNEAKEAVAWVSQLYKEGIIDPSFTQQTEEDAINKFITGKAGACLVSIYPEQIKDLEEKWMIYNTIPIEQSVDILPIYYSSDGYRYNEVNTFSTGTMFSSRLNDIDLEKVLNLMDWMYSKDGRMYFEYGDENKDYSLILGDIVAKNNSGQEAVFFNEKNTEYRAIENLVSWNLDYPDFYMEMMTEFQAYGKNTLEYDIWDFSYDSEIFTNGMITPELCIFNLETVARDRLFEVIMISSDFENSWNEYVDYCYNNFNVEEASAEVEQKANELGLNP